MSAPATTEDADGAGALGPRDRGEGWVWLAIAMGGLLAGMLCAQLFASIALKISGSPKGLAALSKSDVWPLWFAMSSLVGLWVGFAGAAWVATIRGRSLGLRFRPSDALYVLVGIGLQLAIVLAYLPFHPRGLNRPVHQLLGTALDAHLVVVGLMTVVLTPVFEELYFRGVVLRGLLAVLSPRGAIAGGVVLAVLLDGVFFAVLHLGLDSWIQVPGLAAVGVVLACLAYRTGRLGPSIATHVGFNFLAVASYAVSR